MDKKEILEQLISKINGANLNPTKQQNEEINNLTNELMNMPNVDKGKLTIIAGGLMSLKYLRLDNDTKKETKELLNYFMKIF